MNKKKIFAKLGIDPALLTDLHVIRLFSSFVGISGGRVLAVTDPNMTYCPLVRFFYHDKWNGALSPSDIKNAIKEIVEDKISTYGFFTDNRELVRNTIAVPYGASEFLMYALKKKTIDGAVVACDGAGSVITGKPEIVQGIGARMNGLFHTTPLQGVISRLRDAGCAVPFENGRVDQKAAAREAARLGYGRVAVTVNGYMGEDLKELRIFYESIGVKCYIFMICCTGVSESRVKEMIDYADVIWSCGSSRVREQVGKKAILQITKKIPVFVLTPEGLEAVSGYASDPDVIRRLHPDRQYLIAGDIPGEKIGMGRFRSRLSEAQLPVRSSDKPVLEGE